MAKEERDEQISKIVQMINALPDKDIDALERVIWSMSRSSDRVTVYKGYDKYRVCISFTTMQTVAIAMGQILQDVIINNSDKFIMVIYSDVKVNDPFTGKTRKYTTEEMKNFLSMNNFNSDVLKLMHFTTDTPTRNNRTIIDPDVFNLKQLITSFQ
jgi:esterase/lipase superfamily enzyme